MTTRTQVDFLFAFQTLMLAEIAKAPMHWSRQAIFDATVNALETSRGIPPESNEDQIVEAARTMLP